MQGNAIYFGTRNPRLDVCEIQQDPERDYLEAFDSMRRAGEEIFGEMAPEELLVELYS